MKGLHHGIDWTDVFWVHPSTFKVAGIIAQNAEHNFMSARLGWNGYNSSFARATSADTSAYYKPEPIDRSNDKDECEAGLHVAKQRHDVRRCYTCGSTTHLRPTCPLQKQRQTSKSRNAGFNQKSGMAGETSIPSKRGALYWARTELCYFSTR